MSDDPKYRDEEWLREQYAEKERTTYDIADGCGCSDTTVRRWLERYGIERRVGRPQPPDDLADEEWLRKQYVEDRRTVCEIADECERSNTAVRWWLNRHGIETRGELTHSPDNLTDEKWLREQYVEKERTTYDIADECGCAGRTVSRWLKRHGIETRQGGISTPDNLTDEKWLREQYVEGQRAKIDIADECGCSITAVSDWMDRHGIESRDTSGENNPLWNGGPQIYGPGWSVSKRREVRERDDHTCQDPTCTLTQDDHLDQYDEKLHVHHLIKARDIDDPEERNAPENLITLCRDCHQRWERLSEAGIRPQIDGVTAD